MLEDDEEIQYELDVRYSEYIAAAYNSLSAVELFDTGLMNDNDKQIIKNIQFQAISIISESLNNIYNEIFDTSDVDDDDDLVL